MSTAKKKLVWPWIAAPAAIVAGLAAGHFWVSSPSTTLSAAATQALAADGMTPVNHVPAPNFHLVNQNGQPVSLSQFRGKAVVMTFLDPVCWWDCPIDAQEMVDMNHLLGPKLASRVALVAVVANPEYHSVSDVQAFDKEHGLTHVKNWTYATSSSLSTLKTIWHQYYEYVNAPKYGMVQHTDVFWLISPNGQEEWLSDPSARTQYIGGTSQLLATYVAKMLHASLPTQTLKTSSLGHGIWQPMGLSYALSAQNLSQGWALYPYQGYRGLGHTVSGGSTWHFATPLGETERGGIEINSLNPSTAWLMIGAYGLQPDPMVRVTTNSGASWSTPWPVPGAIPPEAIHPLAATSSNSAWILANHKLLETQNQGQNWTTVASHAPWVKDETLSAQTAQSLWVTGMDKASHHVSIWHYTHGWHAVSVPVPTAWNGLGVVASAPEWSSSTDGGMALSVTIHGRQSVVWDATTNAGASWHLVSPTATITGNPAASVRADGNTVYALQKNGSQTQVISWQPGQTTWTPVGTPLPNQQAGVALAVPSSGILWVMSPDSPVPVVWTSTNNGATWVKSGAV
ncbi:hypothetical protein BXT84_13590 [Sulfobacillus thermotolerans]|uniref:Thioredoxin domain-containing protein n=1 Tax=Sulfobacillus thermotolerans TaxID=338644 RepID=A0ABN5H2B3_9FIRM|nr:hypothetical protein BXT84_13590 [Sulfobacillus thermotolerans]